MALLIIVSAIAAWLVVSLPVAVIIGRISRRADAPPSYLTGGSLSTAGMAATGTGAIAGITR